MQRVVIFGYFGAGNLGDETNLRELVIFLRKLRPQLQITVISASPELTARKLAVAGIGKYDFPGIDKALRQSDWLIGGGGGLFQDRSSLRSLFYYVALIWWAGFRHLNIFLYGQGIGPVRSTIGKRLAGWALSQVWAITVRDRLSKAVLENLRVRGPKVRLTAEPLLLTEQLAESEVKRYWAGFPAEGKYKVGLIFIDDGFWRRRFWSRLLDKLERAGVEPYLMATTTADWRLNHKLAQFFDIPFLPAPDCWETLQQTVGGLDLVVSARLHGLVAAVVQGTPCYGLALDPKITGFCISLQIKYSRISARVNPVLLGDEILNYLEQPVVLQKPWQFHRNFWRNRALENQIILAQVIRGKP